MNLIQRIAKNSGILFISQILSYILGFFYYAYGARYLGVSDFGILSFAIAFTGIFGILLDLGLNTLTVRELARDKSLTSKYIGNVAVIKIFLTVLTVAIIIVIVNLIGYSQTTIYVVYILTFSAIISAFSAIFLSVFQAYEKMEYSGVGTILNSVLILCGAIIVVYGNWGLIAFSLIYLIASIIVFIYYVIVCSWKFELPKFNFDLNFLKPTLKEALPFGLTGLFATIYVWIDTVMLSFIQGNEAVGLYSVAYRLILILLFIPIVINSAIFPVMSQLFISYEDSLKLVVSKYLKLMLIIGIPIGVGTTLLANEIIIFIFGIQYLGSVIALQILIWATVFTFANAAFVKLFESTNRQLTLTKITLIGMAINIILNLLLIPRFSYVAASINTVITEFIVVGILLVLANNLGYFIKKREILNDLIKVVIASSIMGIFIVLFKELNLIILIPVAAVIYFLSIYKMGIVNEKDIELIKRIKG